MKRRKFGKIVLAGSVGLALPAKAFSVLEHQLRPLQKGDKIGLISPGFYTNETKVAMAVSNCKKIGLVPYHTDRVNAREGYLAGSDETKLADIHEMYADPSIKGIWCIAGGYGASRYVDRLDFELIKRNPKPLIGFSDVTVLVNIIQQKTGSPCFHGPCIGYEMSEFKWAHIEPIWGLKEPYTISALPNEEGMEEVFKYQTIKAGVAKGELVGGNLSLLVALSGTNTDINTENKIIFIEDIGEAPYRVDRMLTQLLASNYFKSARGVIFGQFNDCETKDPEKQSLLDVIKDRTANLDMPIMYGFPVGHVKNLCTFPIGVMAEMDTEKRTVTLLEDAYS